MSNPGRQAAIAHYLQETVWQYHVPGGGYDVERMVQAVRDHFGLAPAQEAALRELAGQIAAAHCPQCGAALQAGGQACFCCGWTRT